MEWKWSGRSGSVAMLGLFCFLVSLAVVLSDRSLGIEVLRDSKIAQEDDTESNYVSKMFHFLWQTDKTSYNPVWPVNLFYHLSDLFLRTR